MSCTSVLFALPVPPMMPSVSPAFTRRLMSVEHVLLGLRMVFEADMVKLYVTPCQAQRRIAVRDMRQALSSTSTIRPALASERVSSKKTLEIIMSEFMICMT